MAYLGYALGFIGTAAFLFGVSWVARAVRRHHEYDDLLPIDYGAFEADLINHVHDLNKVKR